MRKVKILVAPLTRSSWLDIYADKLAEKLSDLPYEFEFTTTHEDDATAEDVKGKEIVVGSIPPKAFKGADELKFVQLNSAGAERYVAPGIIPDGVVIANGAGAYGLAVAEHMAAMTFTLIRHFSEFRVQQTRHEWKELGRIISVENSTIAVLGLGDIGGRYAKMMNALGAHVIGLRKTDKPKPDYIEDQYTIDRLDEIIGRADIIAMVLPGGKDTENIIDARRISLMKDGVYLINVGRGSSVNPDALKAALKSGKIAGAALDVTSPEPLPKDDELWDMENVLITPHIAGKLFLDKTVENLIEIGSANIRAYLTGGEYRHLVNRKAGY